MATGVEEDRIYENFSDIDGGGNSCSSRTGSQSRPALHIALDLDIEQRSQLDNALQTSYSCKRDSLAPCAAPRLRCVMFKNVALMRVAVDSSSLAADIFCRALMGVHSARTWAGPREWFADPPSTSPDLQVFGTQPCLPHVHIKYYKVIFIYATKSTFSLRRPAPNICRRKGRPAGPLVAGRV